MNVVKSIMLMIIIGSVGCTAQLTPYKVIDSMPYDINDLPGSFGLGITEQKVSNTEYVITAKLDKNSSVKRAKDMVRYHAALLAIDAGFNSFKILKARDGGWCNFRRNADVGRSVTKAGPSAAIRVKFLNDTSQQNNEPSSKIYNAEDTIASKRPLVFATPSAEEMKVTQTKRYENCRRRHM